LGKGRKNEFSKLIFGFWRKTKNQQGFNQFVSRGKPRGVMKVAEVEGQGEGERLVRPSKGGHLLPEQHTAEKRED